MLGFTRCASTLCFTQAAVFLAGIPVCEEHRSQLEEHFKPKSLIDPNLEPLDLAEVKRLQAAERARPRVTKRVALSPAQSDAGDDGTGTGCVYYVTDRQVAEYVKIGTTTSAKERFRNLAHPSGNRPRLLVAELGGREQEAARHRQFAHLRRPGTEMFRYTDELVDHIASLRTRFPQYRSFTNVGHAYD